MKNITISVITAEEAYAIQETNSAARIKKYVDMEVKVIENITAMINVMLRASESPSIYVDIKNDMLKDLPSEYALDAMHAIEQAYRNAGHKVWLHEYSAQTKKANGKSFSLSLWYDKDA